MSHPTMGKMAWLMSFRWWCHFPWTGLQNTILSQQFLKSLFSVSTAISVFLSVSEAGLSTITQHGPHDNYDNFYKKPVIYFCITQEEILRFITATHSRIRDEIWILPQVAEKQIKHLVFLLSDCDIFFLRLELWNSVILVPWRYL